MEKSKPHILHVATARTWRGGEQQVAYLVEELAQMGIPQAVFCPVGSALAAFCRNRSVRCINFRKNLSLNPLTTKHLQQTCTQLNITHLHAHDAHAHGLAVLAAAWFRNRPGIIVHRRVDFPIGQSWWSRWKYNHPSVRRIICVSHFIEQLVRPTLLDPAKLAVVHSGIDLAKFQTQALGEMPLRQAYHVPEGHFLIGNVAAVAPHKDYPTFVRTAELLLQQGFPAVFLGIGGDGGEMKATQRLIEEKGLSDKIKLTGFRQDVPSLLPQLDLLLFTSKTEGLGTTILDAFACGVPVVATAAGGIPELVVTGRTGLTAPVGDADELARLSYKLLMDNPLRATVVHHAKIFVEQFSKSNMAKGVLAVYRSA